jgi:MYXO-CTERM domain-containing protein
MLSGMRRSFVLRGAVALVAAAVLSVAGPARANGRYPASGQIAVDPKDPGVLLVRATYGLLLSHDGGLTWSWICEGAVGYGNQEDPMMGFTAQGTILGGLFEGLSIGSNDGCQWSFVPGGIQNRYVIDLSVDKADPSQAVLVISNSTGTDDAGDPVFLTELWQTADSGQTWAQAGVDMPHAFLGLTVDSAPSDPQRVYVSGRYGPPDYVGTIQRSDDRGATWQALPVTGADSMHLPYIGGVDPNNHDVLYVRLDADPSDTLVVSRDGGTTWSTAYSATGKLYGFAISPDGTMVATGGDSDGVLVAPASTLKFAKVSNVGVKCLTWTTSGLYACADEFKDHFTAGVSHDQGKTFTPLLHLSAVCPLVCAEADSGVNALCPMSWASVATTIDATPCVDGGADGGATGSSSGGGSPHGCSCSLAGGPAGGAALLALAGLAAAIGLRHGRGRRG